MNIKEAKKEIKDAITAYFSKYELGNFEVPPWAIKLVLQSEDI